MSASYKVRAGQPVHYRTAAGRIRHAIVTAVTDQSTVNLRVGNGPTKLAVTGATKVAARDGGGAGWYQGSR
jgi:hypothetical protein